MNKKLIYKKSANGYKFATIRHPLNGNNDNNDNYLYLSKLFSANDIVINSNLMLKSAKLLDLGNVITLCIYKKDVVYVDNYITELMGCKLIQELIKDVDVFGFILAARNCEIMDVKKYIYDICDNDYSGEWSYYFLSECFFLKKDEIELLVNNIVRLDTNGMWLYYTALNVADVDVELITNNLKKRNINFYNELINKELWTVKE